MDSEEAMKQIDKATDAFIAALPKAHEIAYFTMLRDSDKTQPKIVRTSTATATPGQFQALPDHSNVKKIEWYYDFFFFLFLPVLAVVFLYMAYCIVKG